jgi:hypothetical protein
LSFVEHGEEVYDTVVDVPEEGFAFGVYVDDALLLACLVDTDEDEGVVEGC